MKPVCLSIGGLDPSAGAGILLDIKVFSELSIRGFAVASVLTAQSTDKVYASRPIPDEIFADQLKRIFDSYAIGGLKIGLISPSQIALLLEFKEFYKVPIRILDPIMRSSSGHEFIAGEDLLPLVKASTLVIPNYQEALDLLGISGGASLKSEDTVKSLIDTLNCEAVLLKGGHLNSSTDFLATKDAVVKEIVGAVARSSMEVHGTGCLLSSAITAYLATGLGLESAIIEAKKYLSRKLNEAQRLSRDKKFSFSFE